MYAVVPDNIKELILKRIPLGRVADPFEIARYICYLVEDGDYITGQTININGGGMGIAAPHRQAGGHHQRGGLPRLRRFLLHHRRDYLRLRRPGRHPHVSGKTRFKWT